MRDGLSDCRGAKSGTGNILYTGFRLGGMARLCLTLFRWASGLLSCKLGIIVHACVLNCWLVFDCDPMDCSWPGSSVHGISQARILEWVAISFSWGSSWPQGSNLHLLLGQEVFLPLNHLGSPLNRLLSWLRTKCENVYLSFIPTQVKMKLSEFIFEWKTAEG